MDEEKLRRRPPFMNYINVKHTGTSPFRIQQLPGMSKKGIPNSIKQAVERRQQPARAVKQVNIQPVKIVTNEKKPELNKITQSKSNGLTNRIVNQNRIPSQVKNVKIEKIDLKKNVPEKKPILRNTRSNKEANDNKTKKENKENKSIANKSNKPKTVQRKVKGSEHKDKENMPVAQEIIAIKKEILVNQQVDTQHSTRNTKKNEKVPSSANVEPENGPVFQRLRLDEETSRLKELVEKWTERKEREQHLPNNVRDEILSVIGQTHLLISSKFKQFRSLVDECAEQLTRPNQLQMVTPDDLDGFWEMMYIQVDQLNNKYSKLEKLAENTWIDPDDIQKQMPKNLLNKTKVIKKKGQSRFQDFLKQNGLKNGIKNVKKSSIGCGLSEDTISFDQNSTNIDSVNVDNLKCCTTPKAVKNLLTARRSRRSSMNIIMSMSGLGKFDISGKVLPSPKQEKSVRFVNEEYC